MFGFFKKKKKVVFQPGDVSLLKGGIDLLIDKKYAKMKGLFAQTESHFRNYGGVSLLNEEIAQLEIVRQKVDHLNWKEIKI